MVRSSDLGADAREPSPLDSRADLQERVLERNNFYTNLPLEAKERFLEALESAASRGLSESEAWTEAAEAARRAYVTEP